MSEFPSKEPGHRPGKTGKTRRREQDCAAAALGWLPAVSLTGPDGGPQSKPAERDFYYGGQAILEGVMIRGRRVMTAAVRAPSGEIMMHEEELSPAGRRWGRIPLVRGLYSLWDTLNLGMRALNFSANVSLEDSDMEVGTGGMIGAVVMGLAMGIGLFFVLPLVLTRLMKTAVEATWAQVVLEEVLRLGVVMLYFVLIGLIPDLKRLFAYHGAEHKTVHAYEAGVPLDVEHIRPFDTTHSRCGTAFVLLLVVIAILFFSPLKALNLPFAWQLALRVLLVPVVAGVSYEILRLAAKYEDRPLVRAFIAPALLLQRVTTKPPDDDMLEVAVAALERALELDAAEGVPVAA